MPRPYNQFTPEEDRAILSGRPVPEVAAEIGHTPEAVHGRLYGLRHGVGRGGRRRWEQHEDRAIMAEDRPDDGTLADMLDRSALAIRVRRHLLRKQP